MYCLCVVVLYCLEDGSATLFRQGTKPVDRYTHIDSRNNRMILQLKVVTLA